MLETQPRRGRSVVASWCLLQQVPPAVLLRTTRDERLVAEWQWRWRWLCW